jgi:hypothetical protein
MHPTHRKLRDGWGTRAAVEREDGPGSALIRSCKDNSRSPAGMTTRKCKSNNSSNSNNSNNSNNGFRG